jgi:chaperonin cofactor prefoldin
MSDEELQKRFEFITEHLAALTINQERADERLTRLENIVANAYVDMRDRNNALVDAQLKTENAVKVLAESQARLAESQAHLAESQVHTDRRLDALIDIIIKERNGNSSAS